GPSTASRPSEAANAGSAERGGSCSKKPGFCPYPSQLDASDGAAAAISGSPRVRSTMAVSREAISALVCSVPSDMSREKLEVVLLKQPITWGHSTSQSCCETLGRAPNIAS